MINLPTVLILGAGASSPYGYPTGDKLKESIIQLAEAICVARNTAPARVFNYNVHADLIQRARLMFSSQMKFESQQEFGKRERHQEFATAFKEDGICKTIDRFLYEYDEFEEIGRFYAVLTLLICQYKKQVSQPSLKSPTLEDAPDKTDLDPWYEDLAEQLKRRCATPSMLENDNSLKVLTFNYDRSLDLYLKEFLAASPRHKGADWSKAVAIEHLYGELPSAPTGEGAITTMDLPLHAWKNRSSIRLIGDRNRADIEKIHSLIEGSNRVVFVGFGFDDENMELLGLPRVLRGRTTACHNYLSEGSSDMSGTNRKTRDLFRTWSADLGSSRHPLSDQEKTDHHRKVGASSRRPLTVMPLAREDFFEGRISDDIRGGLLGVS